VKLLHLKANNMFPIWLSFSTLRLEFWD
jgi:hypothetical protein